MMTKEEAQKARVQLWGTACPSDIRFIDYVALRTLPALLVPPYMSNGELKPSGEVAREAYDIAEAFVKEATKRHQEYEHVFK